jgi:hypothetical protein
VEPADQYIRPTGIPSAEAFGTPRVRAALADLTWEQIAELRESITETVGYDPSPEKLSGAVEPTSPALAKDFRRHSPQDITSYATLVVALIELMLHIYSIVHAVTPVQVTQIINHIESTIIVNPPPAPPPPVIETPPQP